MLPEGASPWTHLLVCYLWWLVGREQVWPQPRNTPSQAPLPHSLYIYLQLPDYIYRGHKFPDSQEQISYPALRTAPVQLKEDAAVPVAFALYGDAMTLSPSSSSETAVVRLIRSSSEICKKKINKGWPQSQSQSRIKNRESRMWTDNLIKAPGQQQHVRGFSCRR